MPKNEPDHTDPMELTGVAFDDPTGEGVRVMAECFADELLRLGHPPAEVMGVFRSPEHRLAHRAWEELGEVAVFALVREAAGRIEEIREAVRRAREARRS